MLELMMKIWMKIFFIFVIMEPFDRRLTRGANIFQTFDSFKRLYELIDNKEIVVTWNNKEGVGL